MEIVNAKGDSYVNYADYAVAIIDEIEHPQHINERFTLVSEAGWVQPRLVRKGKRYALHITYEGNVKLTQAERSKQRVCAARFGVNEFRSLFRDGR